MKNENVADSANDTASVLDADGAEVIDVDDLYRSESKAEQKLQAKKKSTTSSSRSSKKKQKRVTPMDVVIEGELKTIRRENSTVSTYARKITILSGDPLVFGTTNADAENKRRDRDRAITKIPASSKSQMNVEHDYKHIKHHDERSHVDLLKTITTGCAKLKASSIPTEVRLNVKQHNTNLDKFRQKLPVPPFALPSTSLPEWRIMPLENKIPYIPTPAGTMVFSRGVLGQSIVIKQKEFTLTDPKNTESKVLESYDSLHDPHAASYLNKPVVQQVLQKNGLINNNGQVVCSLKDFNMYRAYLRSSYNKTLQQSLKDDDSKFKHEFNMRKRLELHNSETSQDGRLFIRNKKRQLAIASLQARRQNFLQRIEAKQEKEKHLYHCHIENKMRQRLNLAILSLTKTENNRCRLQQIANARTLRTQQIKAYIAAKEKAAEQRVLAERYTVVNAYKLFITEWLMAKFDSQEQRLRRDEIVRKCLVDDQENKALKRIARLEKYRATIAFLNEERHQEERRLWEIVRKYFNRWRERVRFLRQLRPDEQHRSMWDVTDSLRKTIDYLVEQTGHSQFKALVFNLKQLKTAIAPKPVTDSEEEEEHEPEEEQIGMKHSDKYGHDVLQDVAYIQEKYSKMSLKGEKRSRSNSATSVTSSSQFKLPPKMNSKLRSQYESRKQLGRYSSKAGSLVYKKSKFQAISKPSSKRLSGKKSLPLDFPNLKVSITEPILSTNEEHDEVADNVD